MDLFQYPNQGNFGLSPTTVDTFVFSTAEIASGAQAASAVGELFQFDLNSLGDETDNLGDDDEFSGFCRVRTPTSGDGFLQRGLYCTALEVRDAGSLMRARLMGRTPIFMRNNGASAADKLPGNGVFPTHNSRLATCDVTTPQTGLVDGAKCLGLLLEQSESTDDGTVLRTVLFDGIRGFGFFVA